MADDFEQIAQALVDSGYVVLRRALPEPVSSCLVQLRDADPQRFYTAAVGRGREQNRNPDLRRDKIAWIEAGDPQAAPWLEWTSHLQTCLNRRLFLGLFSFESHLALYQPGDFYKTHLDAFRGQSNRVLSLVAYLNRDWQPEWGGELVIYSPESGAELCRVLPELGTLVLFLSEEFPHQVLPATRPRLSVAGWFRVNGSRAGQVDPPV